MFLGTLGCGRSGGRPAGVPRGTGRTGRLPDDASRAKKLRLAAINSIFRLRSHAYHIVGRMVYGFQKDGFHHQPNVQVVRMFNDQTPKDDLSRGFCNRHGIELAKIGRRGPRRASRLDVDAVLLIIEHGDYPVNEFGQILYPRYEFFQEIVEVFEKAGRAVPVFVDKHLSYDHQQAAEMVATAKKLGFPLMAGSSLPVTWRVPQLEPPLGTPFEEGVCTFGFDRSSAEDLPLSCPGSAAVHAGAAKRRRNGRQIGRVPAGRRRLEGLRQRPLSPAARRCWPSAAARARTSARSAKTCSIRSPSSSNTPTARAGPC